MYKCVYYKCNKEYVKPPKKCSCGCKTILKMCKTCGSTNLATNGWCITCEYGDKPYH